jgi:GT2 family glycosyltransferase
MKKKFSIVITYYPPEKKAEVLDSIKKLDYPKSKYEILDLPGKGSPSIYRNKGAEKAKGEIIVFIDDDAIANKDLLKNAENFFKEHPEIDIVGGPQLSPKDEKGFAKISGYTLSSKFGSWEASNRYGGKKLNLYADENYLTTAIMFCKKSIFKSVKFDEKIFPGEDSKFVMDVEKQGLRIAYSPELIVYHKRRKNMKEFLKQVFNYGKVLSSRKSFSDLLTKPFFILPSIFLIYCVE